MNQAALEVRKLAKSKPSKKDKPFKDMEDQLFAAIKVSAEQGLFGTTVTIKVPSESQDLVASFIGELRHGGFKVDVIDCQFESYETVMSFVMIITW